MSNGVTLSRRSVRRILRAQHPDWNSILHDVKKAYHAKRIPGVLYDRFHWRLSTLLEKRPREDGDADEEEREEQAKRPRTDDDTYIDDDDDDDDDDEEEEHEEKVKRPREDDEEDDEKEREDKAKRPRVDDYSIVTRLPIEMLVEVFAAMPWYHIYVARHISLQVLEIIDKHVLRTIREIVIDDEDPDQKTFGYDLPKMLIELVKNPAMPRNNLTKLMVSRTVFPAGFSFGIVRSTAYPIDTYNTAIETAMKFHLNSVRDLSVRGVAIHLGAQHPVYGGYTQFIFPSVSALNVLDIKPLVETTSSDFNALMDELGETIAIRELRIPCQMVSALITIVSSEWSAFPTNPRTIAKGFSDAIVDSDTINSWRMYSFTRGSLMPIQPRSTEDPAINYSIEHLHFYSMDTAFSLLRNINRVYRHTFGFHLEPFQVEYAQFLPNQKILFPNARSIVFDGPYDTWYNAPEKQQLHIGPLCEIITGTANFWSILEPTSIVTDEKYQLVRVCVFDSFSGNEIEPHEEFTVQDIAARCPFVYELYVQRSPALIGKYTGEDSAEASACECELYHVGPTPVEAMKDVAYDLVSELRAASQSSDNNPYLVDINEKSQMGFQTAFRSYAPYYAVGAFAFLETVSFWWTDATDQEMGLSNPEKVSDALMDLKHLRQICIVDGNKLFANIIVTAGHIKYDFVLLRSRVQPLPPTIDDANMRTQRCYLWSVDDDTIRSAVGGVSNIHSNTTINGRTADEWIDRMDEVSD